MKTYISDKFAEDFAEAILVDDIEEIVQYLKDSGMLEGYYTDFEEALEAVGISSMAEAFAFASDNPHDVDVNAELFKVECNTITSGDNIADFCSSSLLRDLAYTAISNEEYGDENWALEKYARYTCINNNIYVCSVDTVRRGTLRAVINLVNTLGDDINNEEYLHDLLEDVGMAIVNIAN